MLSLPHQLQVEVFKKSEKKKKKKKKKHTQNKQTNKHQSKMLFGQN